MKLSEAKAKGIFKKTIYIGEFFDGVEEKDIWIRMREPNTFEADRLREDAPIKEVSDVVQSCIEDHNFEDDSGSKATNKSVGELIIAKVDLFSKIVTEWQKSLPLTSPTEGV